MRRKARRQVSISLVMLVCLSALVAFSRVESTEYSSKVKTQSPETNPLPGKGLAHHPFLYAGEWDTRKPDQTIFLIRGGRVVWTYAIPIMNEKGVLNEFDDIHLLSNGNVLFAR